MDGDAGWTPACIDARMRSLLCLFVCLPLAAQTRPFFFGLTGGIPFGRITSSVPFGPDESRRYTFGITLGAALNEHISVEFNPLYRRTGERFGLVPGFFPFIFDGATQQVLANTGHVRGHSLELPVIGKYTFREAGKAWRPFAGAGFAFQTS